MLVDDEYLNTIANGEAFGFVRHHFIEAFRQLAFQQVERTLFQHGHGFHKGSGFIGLESRSNPCYEIGGMFRIDGLEVRTVPVCILHIGDITVFLQRGYIRNLQNGFIVFLGQRPLLQRGDHDAVDVAVGKKGGIIHTGVGVVQRNDKCAQERKHGKSRQREENGHDGGPNGAAALLQQRNVRTQGRSADAAGSGGIFRHIRLSQGGIHHHIAVLQHQMAGGTILGLRKFVGDQQHQSSLGSLRQQIDDLLTVFRVKVAGGLVGNQNGCWFCQGAGNGKALLLTAGELGGTAMPQLPQIHLLQNGLGFGFGGALVHAGQAQGGDHIAQHGGAGQNAVILGDEADIVPAVLLPVLPIVMGGGLTV